MQIKDDPSLKWPEKMKGDPNKRNKNKYCRFHRDHGHDKDECFDLKHKAREVEEFPWMRPQEREIEREDRRIIAATPRRNKSHHRGKFDRPVVQVQESILEGGAKRPTFWTITKGKVHGRTSNHFHGRRR